MYFHRALAIQATLCENCSHPGGGVGRVFSSCFDLYFPDGWWGDHFFIYFLIVCISCFGEMPVWILCLVLIGLSFYGWVRLFQKINEGGFPKAIF